MKVLFLDDDPERHKLFRIHYGSVHDCTYVWSYNEAVNVLQTSSVFDEAWLDHDLSESAAIGKPKPGEKTGTHVAEFIAGMSSDTLPKKIIIHSFNPVGARRMSAILTRVYGYQDLTRRPFKFP